MTGRNPIQRANNNAPNFTVNKIGFRFVHRSHSGKRLPLIYTSYAILFFLVAFTATLLLFVTNATKASEQIAQGNITLMGYANGPPPRKAPTITSPVSGKVFKENLVEVSGECDNGLFVEIYRNTVYAGSTACDKGGYKVLITLVPGKNALIAKVHDALSQYGPDSNEVTVFLDSPQLIKPPFLIYLNPIQKGIILGDILRFEYQIGGGDLPYGVSIDWGDQTIADVSIVDKTGSIKASHKYTKRGQYIITITANDSSGLKTAMQSIVVVHSSEGEYVAATGCPSYTVNEGCAGTNSIIEAINWMWPALIIALLMTISFWIGEKIAYMGRPLDLRPN